MKRVSQLESLRSEPAPLVLAVGYFDGIHIGHQAVIALAVRKARECQGRAWVLTFDPHPTKILRPESAPLSLTSTQHKLQLIDPLHVEGCVILPFTRELSVQEPEIFIRRLRETLPGLVEIVVGRNWRFGHEAKGNTELLQKLAPSYGIAATVAEPVLWKDTPVSSSRIRHDIANGKLDEARAMLGRPFSILGTVVPGKQIGRQLGFPTANLDPHNEVRPPSGIYASFSVVDGVCYKSAAFLGSRRTIHEGASDFVIESHLIDAQPPELYGKDLELHFMEWVREERKFESREALIRQIASDVDEIRKRLDRYPKSSVPSSRFQVPS